MKRATQTRATRRLTPLRLLALVFVCILTSAHVGSPDVWYDGMAGPYPVRILIKPPAVVPGLADIIVRVRGNATRVLVSPARGDTGPEGTPPPDVAQPVEGSQGLFSAQLWLMARGAYRITVTVEGAEGTGVAIVPVTATATDRLPMPRFMAFVLICAALFLFVGLVSIVGAGFRESLLPPGVRADGERYRRARVAMTVAAVLTLLLLYGGWRWWRAVDRVHRAQLDRALAATAAVTGGDTLRTITFAITDSMWTNRTDSAWLAGNREATAVALIPDHGRIMHMFVVRDSSLATFAHLHPTTTDSRTFTGAFPALPAGRYRVYGDIVEETGDARTIVTTLAVTDDAAVEGGAFEGSRSAGDDGWWSGPAIGGLTARDVALDSSTTMRWVAPIIGRAGEPVDIAVDIMDVGGRPVALEPYLGMTGHAVVAHADASVYIHLHPLGTISTAAQDALAQGAVRARAAGGAVARAAGAGDHTEHAAAAAPTTPETPPPPRAVRITFPYAFPKAGEYRVWIQVRRNGHVLTGAHDVTVQ